MKNALKNQHDLAEGNVELPAGSLWRDLRAKAGSGNGLEWLLLYEQDPLTLKPYSRLLYVKVIILTAEGRKYAESGQSEILHKCNLRAFETAWFCRALAVAMAEWDNQHSRMVIVNSMSSRRWSSELVPLNSDSRPSPSAR